MRLGPGGVRELHWHQQAEWAVVTYGNCRVTILDQDGRPQVADVKEGDLWYFPAGLPHSLQGLDPDGTEFVLAFDNGESSEFNTLLVTDWIAHTPPEVLAKNFGLPVEAFENIPLQNRWIYQSNRPALPLETVEAQMAAAVGKPPPSLRVPPGRSAAQPGDHKRSDCVQVVIALIVTPEGFPLAYEPTGSGCNSDLCQSPRSTLGRPG
jgi:oxalate decarboxylase family bicupin protein